MGRGRQKAKQTKVARQLKYYSPDTDYDALQRELGASEGGHVTASPAAVDDVDEDEDDLDEADEYANWSPERGR